MAELCEATANWRGVASETEARDKQQQLAKNVVTSFHDHKCGRGMTRRLQGAGQRWEWTVHSELYETERAVLSGSVWLLTSCFLTQQHSHITCRLHCHNHSVSVIRLSHFPLPPLCSALLDSIRRSTVLLRASMSTPIRTKMRLIREVDQLTQRANALLSVARQIPQPVPPTVLNEMQAVSKILKEKRAELMNCK